MAEIDVIINNEDYDDHKEECYHAILTGFILSAENDKS